MAVTMNYGAAPTYVKIASQTLASAAASVTFSNIPQGYTDLVLNAEFSLNVSNSSLFVRLNGDTGSNYSHTRISGTGSVASSGRGSNSDQARITADTTAQSASTRQVVTLNFMNYSNTTTNKTFLSRYSSTGGTEAYVDLYRSTAAVTSVQVKGFDGTAIIESGSTFTIYGIKAALVPKASGGDVVVQDGSYWYHAFRTTGAFVPRQALTNVDYLVIAGGGGGTGYFVPSGYGGPGAGGLRSTVGTTGGGGSLESQISLASGTVYTVTIGAGGTSGGSGGESGSNSSFAGTGLTTITSVGGGRRNTTGGSGGGGSYEANTFGAGTTGQGFRGGNGFIVGGGDTMGGGGGGAGAVGGNATSTAGGNGGAGVQITAFANPTGTGVSGFYAGGGGAAAEATGRTAGTGGSGGGGNGSVAYAHATNGVPNTGGGGGAASAGQSGRGGSGLVIVRYPI
jgi:hypothetical protein